MYNVYLILNIIVLSSIVHLPTTTSIINFSYLPSTNLYNHHCPNLNKRNQYHPFASTTRPFSLFFSAMSSPTNEDENENDDNVVITDLARYAIKGLSGDKLSSVLIPNDGGVQTFPDDRRFALLKRQNIDKFDEHDPQWLFKGDFLCAFTAPELLACFHSKYEIVEEDTLNNNGTDDNLSLIHI